MGRSDPEERAHSGDVRQTAQAHRRWHCQQIRQPSNQRVQATRHSSRLTLGVRQVDFGDVHSQVINCKVNTTIFFEE